MKAKQNNRGFTIIELMIATSIFSVILLLCTYGLIQIGNTYYKGITSVRTQKVTRNAMDNITQAIQYGGSAPINPSPANDPIVAPTNLPTIFCAGNKVYAYNMNTKVTSTTFGLRVAKLPSGGCPNAVSTTDSQELLGENMRLTKFTIDKTGNNYRVLLKVTFGDDDLIDLSTGDCKGGKGSQFCSSSELQTVVRRRVNN